MASLLPEDLLKTTVLIGVQKEEFQPVGTGFLLAFQNKILLLTCKHVAEKDDGNFTVVFNLKNGERKSRSLKELKEKYNFDWKFHKTEDIAAIIFAIDTNQDDLLLIPDTFIERYENIEIGDDVFFLGYPMGITSQDSAYPLARSGIISTKFGQGVILIDGNAFPGNSGGPAFLKPSIFDLKTKTIGSIRPSKFIGMLFEIINYSDVAISIQTQKPRVIFLENAALAKVYSVNKIFELLDSEEFKKYINGEIRP